jgi:hypothetical protein
MNTSVSDTAIYAPPYNISTCTNPMYSCLIPDFISG